MQFIVHDLGNRHSGEIVEVVLSGNAANVRLMDSSNFSSYKNGGQHHYYGGLAKQSPVHLQIPNSGHWYVTVDMLGMSGSVRSSARVLPGPLPELREIPLSRVPSLIQRDVPPNVNNFCARRLSEYGRACCAPFAWQLERPKHGFGGGLRIGCKSLIQGEI